jgi:hypothetical protein
VILREELLKKVKLIEITTKKVVTDVLTGRYKSHFKGQGVQFSEHRQYVPGDDVRHIDWKVSARTRDPLIKKFEEERELSVLLVIDLSASGVFSSREISKQEVLAEIAGVLAHAASQTGDKVGAILFSNRIVKTIPLRKGRAHVQRMIRDVFVQEMESGGTALADALDSARRVLKHSGVVFVVSDFLAKDFEKPLQRLARKHDVIAIRVRDSRESEVPVAGQVWVSNPETGEETLIDTESQSFRNWFREWAEANEKKLSDLFKKSRIEQVLLSTDGSHADLIVRYFQSRSRGSWYGETKRSEMSHASDEAKVKITKEGYGSRESRTGWWKRFSPWGLMLVLLMGPVSPLMAQNPSTPSIGVMEAESLDSYPPGWEDLPVISMNFVKGESSEFRIGDVVAIRLGGVDFQKGMQFREPSQPNSGEIRSYEIVTAELVTQESDSRTAVVEIGLLADGDIQIPSLGVMDAQGKWIGRTDPWLIPHVKNVLTEDESKGDGKPHQAPPRGPKAVSFPASWVALFIALIMGFASFLSLKIYRFWKKRRSSQVNLFEAEPIVLPEDEEALEALRSYRSPVWIESKSKRELYFAVSETVKRYAGRRWGVDALEATSDETLTFLKANSEVSVDLSEKLGYIFERLDRVKFADQQPPDGEPLRLLDGIESFVRATRRIPVEVAKVEGQAQ